MSSETKTMKKKSKRTLTPKLRFPEFRDELGWEAEPLGSVSQFVKKKVPPNQLNIDTYVSTENISPDYGGIEQASKLPPNGSATEYKPDDILIANIRPYLKKVWRSNRSGGASNDVIVIRSKAVLRKDYLPMVIANDAFISYVMKTAKGVKMPRGDIASMKEYIVYYPTPAEQQKIADCLSSLDDLIAAEGRKLTALRDHKRGLMQQLFPGTPTSSSAVGESAGGDAGAPSQPRLRFPEFRERSSWGTHRLDAAFSQRQERGFDQLPLLSVTDKEGVIPQEESGRKSTANADKSRYLRVLPGDIAYNTMRMWEGRSALVRTEGLVSPAYTVCEPASHVSSEFFAYYVKTPSLIEQFRRYSQGLVKDTLNLKFPAFAQVRIASPDLEEQQKIAECLSSLDGLIAAQAAKIESLKQHKRGLMQQLFPAPEEV